MKAKCFFTVLCGLILTIMQNAAAFEIDWDGSIGPGEHKYVPAISNPLFNETPYITTEARPIYLHQNISNRNIAPGLSLLGGNVDVFAVELRMALTDRLGIIASKDGYADIDFNSKTNGVGIDDEDGFANISLGLKYALWNDYASQSIVTVGIEYEAPTGDLELDLSGPAAALLGTTGVDLNKDGDGFINPFVTAAKRFEKVGVQGSVGANLALDGGHDSSLLHYSLHLDYAVTDRFYPVAEFNGFTIIDEGNRTPFGFDGVDLINLGAGKDNGTVLTAAGGFRYLATDHAMLGAGIEKSLGREDLLDWRTYVDLVIHF